MKSLTIFLTLIQLLVGKLIYDFKKSYVINLTPNNYVDQISKYRQNTNYVSIVQFYKYSGIKISLILQIVNHYNLYLKWIIGQLTIEVFLELEQQIVINIKNFV